MANNVLATEFLEKFRSESQSLAERITSASGHNKQSDKEAFLSAIAKLRKDLIHAMPYLPTYDQHTSEQRMKSLEKQIDGFIEGSLATSGNARAGSRFSFKRVAKSAQVSGTVENTAENLDSSSNDATPASLNATNARVITPATSKGEATDGEDSQKPTSDLLFGFHKRSREFLTFSDLNLKEAGEGTDVTLSSLSECVVNLTGGDKSTGTPTRTIRAFHAKGLRRCIIMVPNVQGSALIHDCEDCIIAVACYQFRIHTSTRTVVYLRVSSTPVIEKCTVMRFAPYTLPLLLLPSEANRDNQFANVQDFSWIRASASPNWSLLEDADILKGAQWPLSRVGDIDACLKAFLPAASAQKA